MELSIERVEYVDWKGKSIESSKHGGKRGATFVCVTEILENMVFISNASNLVTYFHLFMNYSLARSSAMLTNYMGTSFLLTLLGGFISDSFVTRFWSIILFGAIQLLGLIILTIQAQDAALRPPSGKSLSSSQAAMLYVGLYAMALGVGGIKANLPAHGADQLDRSNKHLIASYFNWFFFCLCTGGMLAVTFLVWVQVNKGWQWGLGFCAISLFVALVIFAAGIKCYKHKVPSGSPLTRILKVFFYTARNWKIPLQAQYLENGSGRYQNKFRFLEKATLRGHVSTTQVEETKCFLKLLPIFASTIMMNCCLAQLQTFSVEQGITMNTRISHDFQIPPASLTTIPLIVMLTSVPLYDRLTSSMVREVTGKNLTLLPLQRIGIGLLLASGSMLVAALVELKRKHAVINGTNLSVFWLSWQYLLLGVSDMFTLAGMLEFFYSEAPDTMRSICTSLSWCSTALGYFLSSLLVTIVNSASARFGSKVWIGKDLNQSRLEFFYILLAVLNFVNFLNYLFWARWY